MPRLNPYLVSLLALATFNRGKILAKEQIKSKNQEFKPKFTEEELELVRSLPKKEREQKVRELRAKYLALQQG